MRAMQATTAMTKKTTRQTVTKTPRKSGRTAPLSTEDASRPPKRRPATTRSRGAAASPVALGGLLQSVPADLPAWLEEAWRCWIELGLAPICTPETAGDEQRLAAFWALVKKIDRRIVRLGFHSERIVRAASRTRRGCIEHMAVINAPAWPEVLRRTLALIDEGECRRVLDLGGGCSGVGFAVARLRPHVEVVVIDCVGGMLSVGRSIARQGNVPNIRFIEGDALGDPPAGLGDFEVMIWNKVWREARAWRRGHHDAGVDDLDDPLLPRRMMRVLPIDRPLAEAVGRWAARLSPGGRLLTSERLPMRVEQLAWLRILSEAGLVVDRDTSEPIEAAPTKDVAQSVPAWIARKAGSGRAGSWSPDPVEMLREALLQATVPAELEEVVREIAARGAEPLVEHGRVELEHDTLGKFAVERGWMIGSCSEGPMPTDPSHPFAVGGVSVCFADRFRGGFLLLRRDCAQALEVTPLEPGCTREQTMELLFACDATESFAAGPRLDRDGGGEP